MPYPEPLPIDVSKQQQVKNATAQKEMLLNWLSGQKSADVQGQFHCHLINWKLNYANITEIPRLVLPPEAATESAVTLSTSLLR